MGKSNLQEGMSKLIIEERQFISYFCEKVGDKVGMQPMNIETEGKRKLI